MKTVVTGGSGMIGGAVARRARDEGHEVTVLDIRSPPRGLPGVRYKSIDVTDYTAVEGFFQRENPDQVYHFAAVLGTSELMSEPAKAAHVNVVGTANLLQLHESGLLPPTYFITKPNVWLNHYTATKAAAEAMVLGAMQQRDLEGEIHRCWDIYGPGQKLYPIRKAVPNFILRALYDLPIEIYGVGDQTIDMTFAEDVAQIAFHCMNDSVSTTPFVYELASGNPMTVRDLAETIIDLTGSQSKIAYLEMRDGEQPGAIPVADNSRLLTRMPEEFTFTDPCVGLQETIAYIRSLPEETLATAVDFYHPKAA